MHNVVVQAVPGITFGAPIRPSFRHSDERPPVMYGHFCLVPRVSVHDRHYYSVHNNYIAIVRVSYPVFSYCRITHANAFQITKCDLVIVDISMNNSNDEYMVDK